MLELRHLRTLQAIDDAGSLVEAAERLHVTQSALSHQLKDLEHRLGLELIVRRTRPVRFTTAGSRLLALARQILPLVKKTETELKRLSAGDSGRLHIAIECHSCFQWLMPALDRFREDWPEVELDLSAAFGFEPLTALTRGDLDMVVTSDPVDDPAVCYLPLFRYELVLAVARDSEWAARRFIEPGALAEQTLITYPVERERLDVFTAFLDPAGVAPGSVRTAELTPMMVQLVAAGRGVAALPNWALTEYLDLGLVKSVRLGEEGVWRTLYAAVRQGDQTVPFIQDFMETAEALCFKNLSGIRRVNLSA
ncbi:LysR substrate-binding domain-containing protein [Alloalcanivorax xenomutans]|jgi:LysR family transcriptional regulator, regulator for metE and metH|uniref:LysR family transcriptional regulator n=1 Tax=Alloalcanivorax xenomutans TaxID=1094342 RepID=UPI0003B88A1C|nr:LysR family transcriptional regulator [Alloalcanivorax xenomutans]ERS14996.1 XRE family transcriptional regulator [Alcanivorax sp. PN-3]PHS57128.1 MAG: LysR family transcriptional regulator [Alcanivorax sp.]CUR48246.1 Transcriptional activator MetR [Alloalcanivorax xenomutans]SOC26007.1 LysR family transcriptional regulator for metE and metH [Alloalcanivorax xenomutans]|tara:strand:- start:95 stop:1021 length:927 start_codon:yes stop_codon:yes gene_type:complete